MENPAPVENTGIENTIAAQESRVERLREEAARAAAEAHIPGDYDADLVDEAVEAARLLANAEYRLAMAVGQQEGLSLEAGVEEPAIEAEVSSAIDTQRAILESEQYWGISPRRLIGHRAFVPVTRVS